MAATGQCIIHRIVEIIPERPAEALGHEEKQNLGGNNRQPAHLILVILQTTNLLRNSAVCLRRHHLQQKRKGFVLANKAATPTLPVNLLDI